MSIGVKVLEELMLDTGTALEVLEEWEREQRHSLFRVIAGMLTAAGDDLVIESGGKLYTSEYLAQKMVKMSFANLMAIAVNLLEEFAAKGNPPKEYLAVARQILESDERGELSVH